MQKYFDEIERKVRVEYSIAEEARKKGLDPKSRIESQLATSLAQRAVELIASLYPQLNSPQLINRIKELEHEHGLLDHAVCLKIAEEIAKEKFCKFQSHLEAIDAGFRVGFAYITLGVVASPLEGYTHMKLQKTSEGKDYFVAYYSGPIRSAGTTAGAFSLLLLDYLRNLFGYAKYDATEKEIKRAITEIYDYHERITNLQYLASEEEIAFLYKNIPLQPAGLPTEQKEVSNYKDLERVDTNLIRGGFALLFSECLAQKAAKLLKIKNKLVAKGFNLQDWNFLDEFVKLQRKLVEKKTEQATGTYIKDLVAGRPVFGHPSYSGSFRLRYGRSRCTGYSALAIHPATMAVLYDFIAFGTQIRLEKPTKAAAVTCCDSIEGPVVKLASGRVVKFQDRKEALKFFPEIQEIIYLGDLLIPYGDFANRNHPLLPAGYVEEYWLGELKEKNKELAQTINPKEISLEKAAELSKEQAIALHPAYIFYWREIGKQNFVDLLKLLGKAKLVDEKLVLPVEEKGKRALELLAVPHFLGVENIIIDEPFARALLLNLGFENPNFNDKIAEMINESGKTNSVLEIVNKFSSFEIKDKSGTFIGARMGRPEKAKLRELTGSPHVLFPVGEAGGRLRSVQEACEGSVKADFPIYYCDSCNSETIYFICENCNKQTRKMYYCRECDIKLNTEFCPTHGKAKEFMTRRIGIQNYLDAAIKNLNLQKAEIPVLIKGVKGTSSELHIPENLAKGVLRAMFNLHVNKDGSIRYDAVEAPITHFKPKEIHTTIDKLLELGYKGDIYGKELENDEQILEIKPHDVILPCAPDSLDEQADEVFIRVCKFLDNLLVRLYGLRPFYNVNAREDLVGKLAVGIAPHNCAGVVCRIIGFSNTQSFLASPYIHAAMRRDCLGYNSYVPIKRNDNWQIVKIGEFVEELNPKEKADNFGTLKKDLHDAFALGNPGIENIKEITKHLPRKMLKIYLEDGRKIELTDSHKVYLKGKKKKRAYELRLGDKLTVNYKKDVQEKNIKEIFLPEIFQDREDIMLRNIRDYLSNFEKLNKHENFYQRDSFPIKFVQKILSKHNKTLQDLPSQARISLKRDNVLLPIRIPLGNKLLEVIGLYIAEGFSRKNDSKKGFYQISIAGNDEIKNLVKAVFLSHFNLKPSEEHSDHATFSSKIVYELFKNYLQLGDKAKNKRIPSLFLDLKKEKLAALLRGYFEGDGSVSLTDIRVTCDTVSEGLKQDLSFVLSRFDIFTKFYEYEKEPGPKVREFYLRKNRKIPKFKITKIIIPSDFVKEFLNIKFISERKNSILNEICEKAPYGMKIDFDENYAYPKITKIEDIGEQMNYCFNVLPEHNFFANDILVSNCDGDEASLSMLLDILLNFSRDYLPAHRGGTQDAPLVLNARIRPGEVDDMVFDIDISRELPLELYRAAEKQLMPYAIKIPQIRDNVESDKAFQDILYSHETSDIAACATCSAYKKLATMQEKVQKQMELVEKIRAVDTTDVASLIIQRHLIRDIRGNLRKFSMQQFRCVKCNEKYRRPPLQGNCLKCSGRIIFTISQGGIIKYLEPALQLARKYDVPSYVRQSLELTQKYIESMFGRETEKQEALQKWFPITKSI